MSSGSTFHINTEPLNGVENYSIWSVQMTDVLNDMSLDQHIADGAQAPSDLAEVDKWKRSDRRALTQIRLRVAPPIVVDISSAKSALEAWTTLKENYQSEGGIGIILAIRQLFSSRARDNDDMQVHLKNRAEELRTFNHPLDPKVFSLALLTSMPDEWDSWVSAIALDEAQLAKPNKIHAAILMEHRRRHPADSSDAIGNSSAALVARGKFKTPATGKKKQFPASRVDNDRCYNCGGHGHMARECPSPRTVAGVAQDIDDVNDILSDKKSDKDLEEDFLF
jgi:hypothetical protein